MARKQRRLPFAVNWSRVLVAVVLGLMLAASPALGRSYKINSLSVTGTGIYDDNHLQGAGTTYVTGYHLITEATWTFPLINSPIVFNWEDIPYAPQSMMLADKASWSYFSGDWLYSIGTGNVCPGKLSIAYGALTNFYAGPHGITFVISRVPGYDSLVNLGIYFRQQWVLAGPFDAPQCSGQQEYHKVIDTFVAGKEIQYDFNFLPGLHELKFKDTTNNLYSWWNYVTINMEEVTTTHLKVIGAIELLLLQ
jgi:hypothetical protein